MAATAQACNDDAQNAIPANATSAVVTVVGAGGGNGSGSDHGSAGNGASVTVTIPGSVLANYAFYETRTSCKGGAAGGVHSPGGGGGGYFSGANGGSGARTSGDAGGGGGGASAFLLGVFGSTPDRAAIAGGGGGSGGSGIGLISGGNAAGGDGGSASGGSGSGGSYTNGGSGGGGGAAPDGNGVGGGDAATSSSGGGGGGGGAGGTGGDGGGGGGVGGGGGGGGGAGTNYWNSALVTSPVSTNSTNSGDGTVTVTFHLRPAITDVSPPNGTAATRVTITGTDMQGAAVTLAGTPAGVCSSSTDTTCSGTTCPAATSCTFLVPGGVAGGPQELKVAQPDPADVATTSFYVGAAPTITRISPTAGPANGGTQVAITGTDLDLLNSIQFGGTTATAFSCSSSTSCTATTPQHTPGSVSVTGSYGLTAQSCGGNPCQVTAPQQFTYADSPIVTGISPTSGPVGGGTSVTITGTALTGGTVKFGTTPSVSAPCTSATTCTVTAPAHGVGTVDVTVTTPGGGTSLTSSNDQFSYRPTVTHISPTSGPTAGGTVVTITGTGLAGGSVFFGATQSPSMPCQNDTSCTVVSPASANAGPVDVVVSTTVNGVNETSPTSSADRFTYLVIPTITSVSPNQGLTTGGTTVTIGGTNLTGATIKFGSATATPVQSCTGTTCVVQSPAGTGTVQVTATAGGQTSTDNVTFTYLAPPKVTTSAATGVTQTGATLHGSFSTGGASYNPAPACRFELATNSTFTANEQTVDSASACSGAANATTAMSAVVNGLTAGTTYYFRAIASTGTQSYSGDVFTFTTATATTAASASTTGTATTAPPPPPPPPTGLNPSTCTNVTNFEIPAAGKSFTVTGCVLADSEGHYIIQGDFTLNGIKATADGDDASSGLTPDFKCTTGGCSTLTSSFSGFNGHEVAIDTPGMSLNSRGQYTLKVGDTTIFDGKFEATSFDPERTKLDPAPVGPVISLGVSGSGRLHGFPLTGLFTITPTDDGGALVGLVVRLPKVLEGITAAASVEVSESGVEGLGDLDLDIGSVNIKGLEIGDLVLQYNHDEDLWRAGATATIPGVGASLGVEVEVKDNEFQRIAGHADFEDPGIEVPGSEGAAFLTGAGVQFAVNPLVFGGSLQMSAGPDVLGASVAQVNAGFRIAIDSPETIGPIDDIVPTAITFPNVPFALNLNGSVTVAGFIPLASANLNLLAGPGFTTVVTFTGGIGPLGGDNCQMDSAGNILDATGCTPQGLALTVPVGDETVTLASVKANIDAVIQGKHFNAEGLGAIDVLGLNLSGKLLVSTKGLAACAQIGGSDSSSRSARFASLRGAPAPAGLAGAPLARAASTLADVAAAPAPSHRVAALIRDRSRALASARALTHRLIAKARRLARQDRSHLAGVKAHARAQLRALARRGRHQSASAVAARTRAIANELTAAEQTAADAAARHSTQISSEASAALGVLKQRIEQDGTEIAALAGRGSAAARAAGGPLANAASIWTDIGDAFVKFGNEIVDGVTSAYNTVKDAVTTTIDSVVSSAQDAFNKLGDQLKAGWDDFVIDARTGLANFKQTVVHDIDLAKHALEQFYDDVQQGLVDFSHLLQDAFKFTVGVGYKWGGTPDFYATGGCDVGPYVDTISVGARSAQAGTRVVHLEGGHKSAVLRIAGDGAPPLVSVTPPHGPVITTPTDRKAAVVAGGQAVVIQDPSTNTTFVQLAPHAGSYQVSTLSGSAPLRSISTSYSLPAAQVRAHVTGTGAQRTLHWKARPIPGQRLLFTAIGPGGAQTLVDTSRASGSATFTPTAGGAGTRTVQVQVEQNGMTRTAVPVATFSGPRVPLPRPPRRVGIRRVNGGLIVYWSRAVHPVDHYHVEIATTDGQRFKFDQRHAHAFVPNILPRFGATATVTDVDVLSRASGPRTAKLAAPRL